ncbi:unnamed protein product, partial [Gadus morhua 'NCC']
MKYVVIINVMRSLASPVVRASRGRAEQQPTKYQQGAMEASSGVEEDLVFRGVEFSVKVEMENGLLAVEISDVKTADQWRGEFDPAFSNLLQYAGVGVRQTSDSVTLDLLTYADLELLRNRKAGVVGRPRGGQQSPALGAKRYLILIYTVEFDRIHYPLPVPYKGKPDPAALQREIRALRTQLSAATSQGGPGHAHPETQRLRAELAQVREEKQALAHALQRLQGGGAGGGRRRSQEQRLLVEQLEELRESERRSARPRKGPDQRAGLLEERPGDTRLLRRLAGRHPDPPVAVPGEGLRDPGEGLSLQGPGPRRAGGPSPSGSRERADDRVLRSGERGRRADSSGPRAHNPPTLALPHRLRGPRFDPTAYIQDRQRRLKEADLKSTCLVIGWLRKTRRDMLASPVLSERGRSRSREHRPLAERSGSRGRSLSTERRGSRPSSAGSVVDEDHMTGVLLRGRKPVYNGASAVSDVSAVGRGAGGFVVGCGCRRGQGGRQLILSFMSPLQSRGNGSLGRKPLCSTPT